MPEGVGVQPFNTHSAKTKAKPIILLQPTATSSQVSKGQIIFRSKGAAEVNAGLVVALIAHFIAHLLLLLLVQLNKSTCQRVLHAI